MKNLKILMMAVAGCFAISSCNNDDDDSDNNANFTGTYNMTAWNAPVAYDFDDNGTTSTNFMTETNCYNNSTLKLNSDGTYNMSYNALGVTGTDIGCSASEVTTGTWTRSGNTITTTGTGGTLPATYTYANGSGSAGATLTRSMTNAQYPTLIGGNAAWANGNVNIVFTRPVNN